MRIYLSDIETLRGAHIDALLQKVPECRRQKALRFKQERDRLQCLGAGLLLSHALSPFGLSEADAVIGPHGKPYFPAESLPRFSLSHSGSRVMCAVGSRFCIIKSITKRRTCPLVNSHYKSVPASYKSHNGRQRAPCLGSIL